MSASLENSPSEEHHEPAAAVAPEAVEAAQSETAELSFSDSLRQLGDALYKHGSNVLKSGSSAVAAQTVEIRDALWQAGSEVAETTSAALRSSLHWIAADPTKKTNTLDEIINLAPVVGSTRMYASAWEKFQHATANDNADMLQQSRRECLVAIVSAGLDVTTLGVSAAARGGLTLALKGLTTVHLLSGLEGIRGSLINPLADQMLKNESVSRVVDSLLTSVKPKDQSS